MMFIPRLLLLATAAGFASSHTVWADTRPNPYLSIAERNPFGIKPQPQQAPAEPPQTQAAPLAKVVMTGVTSILGPPKVLLEITEMEPGKGPTVNKRVLQAGERDGSIEVLSIDVVNNSVRIKNGGVETNVVFEVAKQGGSGPGVPGAMPTPTGMPAPPPALPTPAVTSASASPMIISSRGGDSPNRANTGVSFGGAEVSPASTGVPSPTYYGNSSSSGNSGYRMASVNTYGAPTATTAAGNTARPLRGDAAQQPQQPQVSLADNIINFLHQAETAKQNNGVIPSPGGGWILPPMPGMDDHVPAPGH